MVTINISFIVIAVIIAIFSVCTDVLLISKLKRRIEKLEKQVGDLQRSKATDNWAGQYKDDDQNKPHN